MSVKKVFIGVVLGSFIATAAIATSGVPGGAKPSTKPHLNMSAKV